MFIWDRMFFFFFKQKTAYEMRISDWSSDVCSSDLPVRRQGAVVDGYSWYFAQFNRNKKSVVLDLYTDAGKDALARLIATADVLVESYRPGVLARMGFDEARLEALNPRLITASVARKSVV